jgi:hypothetical protein
MALPTYNQTARFFKREGTSQTYGQLVIFPSKQDDVPLDPKIVRSPKDIVVKLIPNGGGKLNLARIVDSERSKICLAAFSTNRQAVINLSAAFDIDGAFKESSKQEIVNISSVVQNIQDFAIVVGGSKSASELNKILKEAAKVDLFVTLKSQESEVLEYNNLQTVNMSSKFVYNFYIPEETNIASQEDQTKDPLLTKDIFNVPRYVKLSWEATHLKEPLSDTESDFLKVFPKVSGIVGYGSYDFKDSFQKSAKKTNLINSNGQSFELTDIHNLDVAFNSTNNGKVFTNTINATFDTSTNQTQISNLPISQGSSPFSNVILPSSKNLIRATLPNVSFSELYMSSSAPSLDPTSKMSLALLAEGVSDISIKRETPTGFETISDFLGMEYVGYIIDKERLNRNTGEWHRIDEYKIIGASADSFIDTRVAYGEIYRYRMRTVARVTQEEVVTEVVDNNSLQNINTQIKNRLREEINKRRPLFELAFNVFNRGLSNLEGKIPLVQTAQLFGDYFASFAPDRIDVYQQTPGAKPVNLRTQKLSNMTSLDFINGDFNVLLPIPNQKVVNKKLIYKSYYYESLPSIQWHYVDCYENNVPPAPQSIKISPNTLSKQIFISWLRPSDSLRDIASYKIYRRSSFAHPWTLLKEIKELDVNDDGIPDAKIIGSNSANLFIDTNVNTTSKYIYALSCVDIHGIESFLSAQIQAELNPNFAFEKEEKPLKWISGGGATVQEIDFVYKKFLARNETIVAKNRIKIKVNSKFKDATKNFIIRVTSLDSHEKKEYKLTLNNVSRVVQTYTPFRFPIKFR